MPNAFTTLVGIEIPIVQAPMGGATSPQFAAAVSNAGGLGMLALGWSPPEAVRAEIRATKALTERPFGVNLVLTYPQEERLAICLEESVAVVSFFWGQAGSLTVAAHRGGATVLHTAGSAEQARISAEDGADAIVAQGWEAGGHVYGRVATMALVPAVVDQVAPVPVLAAGGIADGRGLAAAMALGAAGAWIGTRFLASIEAPIHPHYRDRILTAKETDTEYGTVFDVGWPDAPHRSLRNTTIEAWEAAGRPPVGGRPNEGAVVAKSPYGDVVAYQSHTPGSGDEGDIDALALWSGQGVSLVRRVQPAAEIVREISDEARAILARLGNDPSF
ncbi:nitronate monooxygenase [Mesorhizobium sp. AR10]|uniref:NAD(P)H-dependent flavin oxidoreductase n=1 Tax=Mesorhizobium sp. AR10 TaxID=2865839 RepID=UPI00215E1D59|nr:nitronate monooxygenase [Mesorhizobium sp. AR10]UVK37676.1 nitronate monooxygenase [Mesorhizobium sp. AR10]